MKNLPVYKHPAAYAREHDELAAYRASNQANAACKEAIEAAIRDHYRDNRLDAAAVDQVVQQFGYDRTFYILAITVCQADWDRRYSPDNRASACGSALGLCWKAGIAAEVIGMPRGSIGECLQQAKVYLDTPDLFAWTLVIVVISLAFEKVFIAFMNACAVWLERI